MFVDQVTWKRLYKTSSALEKGTLFNLRNQPNRRNIFKKCKNDVNAHKDFFELIVQAYVVSAAVQYLKMESVEGLPSESVIPNSAEMWMKDDSHRLDIIMSIARSIASQHVNLGMREHHQDKSYDKILPYSRDVTGVGLILREFKDAIKEGDGDRCIRVWKYFLLMFRASNRINYAMEAFNFLSQYHIVLSPYLAEGVKWSRFVNTHGLPGHNISCDLHMEHMNKLVKVAIGGFGANKTQKSIIRCGKMVGTLEETLKYFDNENGVKKALGARSKRAYDKDFHKVLGVLLLPMLLKIIQVVNTNHLPAINRRYFNQLMSLSCGNGCC